MKKNIRLDYLKKLNNYYERFIEEYNEGPTLIIDCDKIKFADNEEDFGNVINRVDGQLFGLF